MTEKQIENFNSLYQKAYNKTKGLLILEGYRPKKIGFFEKLNAKKAIKYFNDAILIYPEHFQSLFFLGKLHQRLGSYQKALTYFDAALKLEDSNHNVPQEASLVAMHLNDIDKAIEYSKEALRRKPNDFALLGNLAMNFFIGGFDIEASETIDKAILLNPTDTINQRIKSKIDAVIAGEASRPTFNESIGKL